VWRPLIAQAIDDGTDQLLDGEGGDELFGCSPYLLADLLRRGRLVRLASTARRIPGMGAHPKPRWIWRAISEYGLRGSLPPRLERMAWRARKRRQGGPAWLSTHMLDLVLDSEGLNDWKRLPGPRWWSYLVHAVIGGPDAMGSDDELRREAALNGVKVAHPWRDPRLIAFVLSLPPEPAFDGRYDRALAREAMRGMLPEQVRLRDEKPFFNVLLENAMSGVDGPLLERLLLSPPEALEPFIRRQGIPRLIEARGSGTGTLDAWRLATVALWLRNEVDPGSLSRLWA
jgi:asparagine synthase (glutamine-hydrolysing)